MHRILDRLSGRPYLLLTLTMLVWGGNAVAGRLAVGEVSPMALTGLRWVVPVAVLGVALRHKLLTHRQALLERWPSLLLMGTLGLTVFNALFYLAAHHTTAVNLTILQGSMPVFVLVGALLFAVTLRRRHHDVKNGVTACSASKADPGCSSFVPLCVPEGQFVSSGHVIGDSAAHTQYPLSAHRSRPSQWLIPRQVTH